jgi:hypothetical protein
MITTKSTLGLDQRMFLKKDDTICCDLKPLIVSFFCCTKIDSQHEVFASCGAALAIAGNGEIVHSPATHRG